MLATAQKGYFLPVIEKDIVTDGNLSTCEFCNEFSICFSLEIKSLSKEIQQEIKNAIIAEKKTRRERKWSTLGSDGVEFEYLVLDINAGMRGIRYHVDGAFHDVQNKLIEENISISIDLSKYNRLIRNLVHRHIDEVYLRNC